jgi:hypothetical protein
MDQSYILPPGLRSSGRLKGHCYIVIVVGLAASRVGFNTGSHFGIGLPHSHDTP